MSGNWIAGQFENVYLSTCVCVFKLSVKFWISRRFGTTELQMESLDILLVFHHSSMVLNPVPNQRDIQGRGGGGGRAAARAVTTASQEFSKSGKSPGPSRPGPILFNIPFGNPSLRLKSFRGVMIRKFPTPSNTQIKVEYSLY